MGRIRDAAGTRRWTTVTVDVSSRLTPKNSTFLRLFVRTLLGSMQFNAILLDPDHSEPRSVHPDEKPPFDSQETFDRGRQETLKLWGLSLGMTLDFIAYMHPSTSFTEDYPRDDVTGLGTSIAPSMT